MEIEVKVVTDLYGTPNKNGTSKIIKRGLKFRQTINIDDIIQIRECFTSTGRIDLKKSIIVLKEGDDKYLTVDKPYEELRLIKITKGIDGFRG